MENSNSSSDSKYLSEVIDLNNIQKGRLNLITTPTGSGKSTFALNKLNSLVSEQGKILYIIDTTAGRDQIILEPNTQLYDPIWKNGVLQDDISIENQKITVMTHAKFGHLMRSFPSLLDNIEMIVVDEIHNLFWPIAVERGEFQHKYPHLTKEEINDLLSKTSTSYIALDQIEKFSLRKDKYLVGLTATPDKVFRLFKEEVAQIRFDSGVIAYQTLEEFRYRNLEELLLLLPTTKKYLVYIPTIKSMKKHLQIAKEKGFRAEGIWSIHNEDHSMTFDQLQLRDYLIENQRIPDDIDVLFINRSYETGINIFSHLDAIIIHTTEGDTITQVRGRYRSNLSALYLLGDESNTDIVVPEEYLNIPLTTEMKKELCGKLKLKNKSNKIAGWTIVKKKLIENGYIVEDKKSGSERYSIITQLESL